MMAGQADASGIGLPAEALARIADAVAEAESRTSAEIRVMVSPAPLVRHSFYSVLWAALGALVLPWVIVIGWALARDGGVHDAAPFTALEALGTQAGLFVVLAAVLLLPQVAPRVIPRRALEAAGRTAAIELFHVHGIPQTADRSGILIFVAAHDGLVEVVADDTVNAALGCEAWGRVCAAIVARAGEGRLADGLLEGVRLAGDLLAGPLPPRPGDTDELDNHVIVL